LNKFYLQSIHLGLDWNFFSSHSQVKDSQAAIQAGSLDYSGLSEI
jgi:hypothetical protein